MFCHLGQGFRTLPLILHVGATICSGCFHMQPGQALQGRGVSDLIRGWGAEALGLFSRVFSEPTGGIHTKYRDQFFQLTMFYQREFMLVGILQVFVMSKLSHQDLDTISCPCFLFFCFFTPSHSLRMNDLPPRVTLFSGLSKLTLFLHTSV